eukprot:3647022-Prorocentrum_lima.AAC.1
MRAVAHPCCPTVSSTPSSGATVLQTQHEYLHPGAGLAAWQWTHTSCVQQMTALNTATDTRCGSCAGQLH